MDDKKKNWGQPSNEQFTRVEVNVCSQGGDWVECQGLFVTEGYQLERKEKLTRW